MPAPLFSNSTAMSGKGACLKFARTVSRAQAWEEASVAVADSAAAAEVLAVASDEAAGVGSAPDEVDSDTVVAEVSAEGVASTRALGNLSRRTPSPTLQLLATTQTRPSMFAT